MSLVLRFLNRFRKSFALSLVLVLACTWVGCENLRYYNQAINGQYQIIANKRPIEKVIEDKSTSADLKKKLALVVQLRRFAEAEMHLPAKGQYTQYADVHRRF